MVDRLSSLIGIFARPELDFRKNRAEGDDILGDAYEYLMRHFATESGKSKGQFYTPAEVSRIMAKVIGVGSARSAAQTIYDPTCGSGSLLLKAHDDAPSCAALRNCATRAPSKTNRLRETDLERRRQIWLRRCRASRCDVPCSPLPSRKTLFNIVFPSSVTGSPNTLFCRPLTHRNDHLRHQPVVSPVGLYVRVSYACPSC